MVSKKALTILSVLTVLVLALVPMNAVSADVSEDIWSIPRISSDTLNAGSSINLELNMANQGNTDYFIDISVSSKNGALKIVPASGSETSFYLFKGDVKKIVFNISSDRYASPGDYVIDVVVKASNNAGVMEEKVSSVPINVVSPLASGDAFNKILGVFDNPLPSPLNSPLATAAISFVLYMILCLAIAFIVFPFVLKFFLKGDKSETKTIMGEVGKLLFIAVLLYSAEQSLRIYGAGTELIGTVNTFFNVIYIVVGASIVWKVFGSSLSYLAEKVKPHDNGSLANLEPLIRLMMKLLLAMIGVGMIMTSLGFNLTAIITSAGIVSLGITLGAQNVLNQFFSGITLLATHPFKEGDMIRINGSTTVYRVLSVDIMNSVFENWDNSETIVMPNNMVASGTIVNITDDNKVYKIVVMMTVAYGADTDRAMEIMREVAYENPRVITNGKYDVPSTRINEFKASEIELRLAAFIDDFNFSGGVAGQIRESVYKRFVEENIEIPFTQLDVHLDYKNKTDE